MLSAGVIGARAGVIMRAHDSSFRVPREDLRRVGPKRASLRVRLVQAFTTENTRRPLARLPTYPPGFISAPLVNCYDVNVETIRRRARYFVFS